MKQLNRYLRKKPNKVTKEECMDAIEYFCTLGINGWGEDNDDAFYTEILLKKVCNDYNVELIENE